MSYKYPGVSVHSLIVTTAALLLGAAWQATAAPLPANSTLNATQAEIMAPVEPKYSSEPDSQSTSILPRPMSVMAVEVCSASGYAQKSGQELVDYILQSETSCINDLYDGDSNSFASFTTQKMITVANAAADMGENYNAADNDSSINKLFYFLRTGYYIEYYYPENVSFNENVQNAVTAALDNFTTNPDFYSTSDSNGKAIQDAIVLMDSAGEQARYLPAVKQWLEQWDSQDAAITSMRAGVNGIFTVLFRGHYEPDFVTAAGSDQELIQLLGDFSRSDWMLNTNALFMQENAARELTRFLQYPSAAVYATVVSEVHQLLNRYSATGTGSSVWIAAAGNVDYFGDCSEFDICGFAEDLEQEILADRHTCSSSLKIHAQDMNQSEMTQSCSQLSDQESYFHQLLATNYNPVADDLNTDLEVVVFDDWSEYNTYAPLFYGISTDNGGMYLEGTPSDPNNQARFIAHEADWLRPDFEVWNLTHEYVHYLDGRFNLHGDFGDARTSSHKTVWWVEGLAEYVSKKDFNDTAVTMARTGEFNLSEIFANTYSSGQDRVYRWGYLAVRFMFEKHHSDVTQMLTYLRAGNFDGYLTYINSIGSTYDSEWQSWLQQVESNENGGGGTEEGELTNNVEITGLSVATQGEDLLYFIDIPAGTPQLSVAIHGGSGDGDLYLRYGSEATDTEYDCRPYIGGNTEVCDVTNPQAGRWYVRVKAYTPFSDLNLLASYTTGNGDCTAGTPLDYGSLELNTTTCVVDSSEILYFYVYVPDGTNTLDIQLSGGQGNADLYVMDATWATSTNYDQRSIGLDNNESISVSNPDTGWYYISIIASDEFSGLGIQITTN